LLIFRHKDNLFRRLPDSTSILGVNASKKISIAQAPKEEDQRKSAHHLSIEGSLPENTAGLAAPFLARIMPDKISFAICHLNKSPRRQGRRRKQERGRGFVSGSGSA
jgi:hypothetical protein